MTNGQNVARSRHLEELANAAKRYTLREILDVTEAVATELGGLSIANSYTLPTASTSTKGGVKIGSGLQMDGDTLNVTIQSGSSGGTVLDTVPTTVEGGFWQDTINDTPVLKLRHGDYEYNFKYDDLTYLGGVSAPLATVTPDTYVLGTASVSTEGGVWYEVTDNVPQLKLHAGNFNYGFNYDSITYKGNNANLVAYLPFTTTLDDACDNEWTVTGSPAIVDGALYLNGSSYFTNSTISDSIGAQPWTVDFWSSITDNGYVTFGALNQAIENDYVSFFLRPSYIKLSLSNKDLEIAMTQTPNVNHHYAVSYDGTTIRFFIDGVKQPELDRQITLNGNFYIGCNTNRGYLFIGRIDHFRIWNTALWTTDFTPPTAADYL